MRSHGTGVSHQTCGLRRAATLFETSTSYVWFALASRSILLPRIKNQSIQKLSSVSATNVAPRAINQCRPMLLHSKLEPHAQTNRASCHKTAHRNLGIRDCESPIEGDAARRYRTAGTGSHGIYTLPILHKFRSNLDGRHDFSDFREFSGFNSGNGLPISFLNRSRKVHILVVH